MIAEVLVAGVAAALAPVPAPSANMLAQLKPAAVLQRYAATLARIKEPHVLTFDYTLDQTGVRTLAQTHRVFRSGANERDETLTVDGRVLSPPKVRIFLGRRNRYTVSALAPRPAVYDFAFVGSRKNAHHFDYVFRLAPKTPRSFTVTQVTIDGVRFLPSSIDFVTGPNEGSGTISFGLNAAWWVPYTAVAHAMVIDTLSAEKLSFYTYRFPPDLPPSTFGRARSSPDIPPRALPSGVGARALPAPTAAATATSGAVPRHALPRPRAHLHTVPLPPPTGP